MKRNSGRTKLKLWVRLKLPLPCGTFWSFFDLITFPVPSDLFKVLTYVGYTFFPSFRQFVNSMPMKLFVCFQWLHESNGKSPQKIYFFIFVLMLDLGYEPGLQATSRSWHYGHEKWGWRLKYFTSSKGFSIYANYIGPRVSLRLYCDFLIEYRKVRNFSLMTVEY